MRDELSRGIIAILLTSVVVCWVITGLVALAGLFIDIAGVVKTCLLASAGQSGVVALIFLVLGIGAIIFRVCGAD